MKPEKAQKILVWGAGAIGMAFGGFLSSAHEVTLLGRSRHIRAIRKNGLKVSGIWGRHIFRRFRLYDDETKLIRDAPQFDLILVCVKSYDTLYAARRIRKLLLPQTRVVSLQNGLGNMEALHRWLDPCRVLAGRVIFGVEVPRSGTIKVTVIASPTALGQTVRKGITPEVEKTAQLFNRAGLPSVACADVRGLLWLKVIYNSALNPLATLLGSHYGYLSEHDYTRRLMDQVIREIYAVADRCGVRLDPSGPGAYRKLFYGRLVPSTYHHHPSMLQDIQSGKKTEIQALNGAIVRLAREADVEVPVNRFLVREIRALERGCR